MKYILPIILLLFPVIVIDQISGISTGVSYTSNIVIPKNGYISVNGDKIIFGIAPTISSGFGTGATTNAVNTASFKVIVGTGGDLSQGTLTMPLATEGWICRGADVTNYNLVILQQSGDTSSSVSFAPFGMQTGLPTTFTNGDELNFTCMAY